MILSNYPIVLCFVLVILFQLDWYFHSVFHRARRKPYRLLYTLLSGLLIFVYLTFDLITVLASLLAFAFIFVLAFSFDVELRAKLIFTIIYGTVFTIVNVICLNLFAVMDGLDVNQLDPASEQIDLLFTKALLLGMMMMFVVIQVIRLITRQRSFTLHWRIYVLYLFVPIISIYLANVLMQYSERNIYYYFSFIGLLLMNVLIVYLFDNMMEKFLLVHENARLQQQMDYQDANYEKTVHSFKSIKRIIHDTHQHFLYIDECIRRNELEAALAHIQVTLNKVEDAYHRVNTGNLVIDALVTNTLNIGEANGIRIDTSIGLRERELNIDRYDLCVVLGNMLDNAIEASKKVKIAEDRYIRIEIHSNDAHLTVHVLNHMENDNATLHTQKQNPEFHGIGLTNIMRICEKYGGHMTTEAKNRTFHNMVVLPLLIEHP